MTHPPIVKVIEVSGTPQNAFDVFVKQIGSWWPADTHSVAASAGHLPRDIVFELQVGGTLYEVLPDGNSSVWGTVTAIEPGSAVSLTWHPGRSEEDATQLTVTFESIGADRTKVTLTHSDWQALRTEADRFWNDYDQGWDQVFGRCYLMAI